MSKDNETEEAPRGQIGDNAPPQPEKELFGPDSIGILIDTDIEGIKDEAKVILDTVTRIPEEIENDDQYSKVVSVVASIRGIDTKREKKRKEHKAPYTKAGSAIDDGFKIKLGDRVLSKEMADAIKDLTSRLSTYDTKKLEAEEARIATEAADLAESAKKDGITIATSEAEVILGTHKSEHGGMSTRQIVNDWEIVDEAKLPKSVLSPDPKKIQELIDNGATKIPGVKITRRVQSVVKRR